MAKKNDVNLEIDEVNLEDLIILGEHKKIPVLINYPKDDGTIVKETKVLIRQLTLKEMEDMPQTNNLFILNIALLKKAMFKVDGSNFNEAEIYSLPIGVVNAVSDKIREISGVDFSIQNMENF